MGFKLPQLLQTKGKSLILQHEVATGLLSVKLRWVVVGAVRCEIRLDSSCKTTVEFVLYDVSFPCDPVIFN